MVICVRRTRPQTFSLDARLNLSPEVDLIGRIQPQGTARAIGLDAPFRIAGKSGTAQVFSVAQDETYNEEELAERMRDHALFVAFAPVEDPHVAVAVIVENGGSGSGVAGPVARSVLDQLIDTPAL